MANFALKRLFGKTPGILSDNVLSRLCWRLSRVGAIRRLLARRGTSVFPFAENGHSVCIVGTYPLPT